MRDAGGAVLPGMGPQDGELQEPCAGELVPVEDGCAVAQAKALVYLNDGTDKRLSASHLGNVTVANVNILTCRLGTPCFKIQISPSSEPL